MVILGIESSCDETACAIVKNGTDVLSNVVYTQIKLHQPWGGVVPEIASRAHVEKISGVVASAVKEAVEAGKINGLGDVDAVAVTYGPGLAPALLVGLNAAKGLAMSLGVPLIGINHIEAHLHTPFLESALKAEETMPALGLAVSGGHTSWIDMPEYGEYRIIGQTLDDAAGEAFDKAAKLLGLGYPGGPVIDKKAKEYEGNEFISFPKGRPRPGTAALAGLEADLCTSFSGLKTALLNYVRTLRGDDPDAGIEDIPRICASYQKAIVDSIADRTATALKRRKYRSLIVGGGVSLNGALREALKKVSDRAGVELLLAKPKYCGDNAAMIAGLAYHRRNVTGVDAEKIDVHPSLEAGEQSL
ncbi:MAG: tRNA (adenosine(37)-N6)-threonylcarbamoyltransferase complex transferase subunit TsaD [Kiritimatiellae bacterium]|nr:tRNA (adenosine(37)-N6)-threonylcarbamoyltransferase complex transferase subunit TsaD [Kiritimatiellia bacterium]